VEPKDSSDDLRVGRRLNWTTIGLIGALVLLVVLIAYLAIGGNPDEDKLTRNQLSQNQSEASAPSPEKLCASHQTYDLIRRELFRRAAELRGRDQAAYDSLSGYALLRMENPVMESEDAQTGAVNCAASMALDLPPGVAAVGGRKTLRSDIDYTVQQAADGSGTVVELRNADSIISQLATLSRIGNYSGVPSTMDVANQVASNEPTLTMPATPQEPAKGAAPPQNQAAEQGPSFSCARPKSRAEAAICGDEGLSSLDRDVAWQFGRALADATPEQRGQLESSRNRFLAYRDRCPDRRCMAQAYIGRLREIRDIVKGRWQPPQ
jgi:hypothetical protein